MSIITRWKSPPHPSGDSVPDFRYPVLRNSKTGIRLAHIQPGSGSRAIAIDLLEDYVTGPDRTPYDALSYTWGDGLRDKNVFCNGKRLPVTKTLWEALNRFRHPDDVVTLWVDWICVCQERVRERNAQVNMMGDIFKSARKVIVWLGDDYDDSRAGMQLAKQLLHIALYQPVSGLAPTDLETHGLPKRGHKRWKALALILRRPWFWRTWVVQEVAMNPNVELVLGSLSFTWNELEMIVSLLEGQLPQQWDLDQAVTALELPFSRINRIRLRHQRHMMALIRQADSDTDPQSEQENQHESEPDLLDLLFMSRHLGATDPRDKIYALLGLGKHDVSPDYSMSPYSVYTDFALQMIGTVTNELEQRLPLGLDMSADDFEVRRAMIMLSCAGRQNQDPSPKLASWVPDWSVDLRARPLIFGVGRRFSAGGTRLGLFDWQPDSGLQLCGKIFDTIHQAGRVRLDHSDLDASKGSHAHIAEWWREAQTIALARTVRSPGSFAHLDAFDALRRDLMLCKHGYYTGKEQQSHRHGSLLDDSESPSDPAHSATRTLVLGPTRGRVLFVSAAGWVGLAPHGAREGDLVFVAVGADVPYVLRSCGDGYELIGECYVQGIMDGEVMGMDWIGVQDVMIR
ncbi:hypothetical protein WHR41_07222 [Cladosporium halotolerans]|uniref:Heterokaryon incompatibility domain-containing protein n=1 Tax=Cladosporium halotolerans TaxID=1052096 RepID=A0AB34KK02_9PEZI